MDITRIRYFSALAELQHVRRAAEVLGINAATLSRAIKVLEHEVRLKLIAPSGRGIEVTDEGRAFYRRIQPLLREFNLVMASPPNSFPEKERALRIGSMEIFTTYFLSHFLETRSVSERLRVLYLTPGKIEEAVKSQEIDLGITYIRLAEKDLQYQKLGEFKMRIYGHQSWKKKAFEDLRFAVPIDGVDTPSVALRSLDGWENEKFPRFVQFEFELLESALQLSRIGKAVVYCPNIIAKLHNQALPAHLHLHEIPSPPGLKDQKLSVYLVQKKNRDETPFIRDLAKTVRSLN